MTEHVTVKTGFKKLPDSDALALAGTVIKGAFVDKSSRRHHPSMRQLCKPRWMI